MSKEENEQIVLRFFEAFDYLVEEGAINNVASFTRKYGITRPNFYKQRANVGRNIFKPCWLTYLVRDYGVSAEWLLTGEGEILKNCK